MNLPNRIMLGLQATVLLLILAGCTGTDTSGSAEVANSTDAQAAPEVDSDGFALEAVAFPSDTDPPHNIARLGRVWFGQEGGGTTLFDLRAPYVRQHGPTIGACLQNANNVLVVGIQDGAPAEENSFIQESRFTEDILPRELEAMKTEFDYFREFEAEFSNELPNPTDTMAESLRFCASLYPEL